MVVQKGHGRMTHQVVAIGDIHLRAGHSRNAARLTALDAIIAEGMALPSLVAWIQLGDIFDGRSSVTDRNDLAPRLQTMAERADVIIIGGNHEVPGDTEILARLEAAHPIQVITEPRLVDAGPMSGGSRLQIAVMPYPSKAGLIAAGTAANETLQAGGGCLEDILRDLGAQLADAKDRGHCALFVGHVMVAGSIMSSGQSAIGRELEIAPISLHLLGDVPIVLGHVHEPQAIGGAYFAGSIAPMDWGETTPRSYIVVECQRDGDHWEYRVGRRPIHTARLFHIEGQLTRDGFTFARPADAPATWGGCEVRVRFKFQASERTALDEDLVRRPFQGADVLQTEPVAIPDRALRAPEVATARTLREKVEAWGRVNNLSLPTSAVGEKLASLELGDAASVLSAIATEIAELEKPGGQEVPRAA